MSKTMRVTAGDGRVCPIHPSDLVEGGAMFVGDSDMVAVRMVDSVTEIEVKDSVHIRRRIRSGDLVVVPDKTTMAARRTESVDAVRGKES